MGFPKGNEYRKNKMCLKSVGHLGENYNLKEKYDEEWELKLKLLLFNLYNLKNRKKMKNEKCVSFFLFQYFFNFKYFQCLKLSSCIFWRKLSYIFDGHRMCIYNLHIDFHALLGNGLPTDYL